jgi:hypothetical protein
VAGAGGEGQGQAELGLGGQVLGRLHCSKL